jgi:Ankyrin repeats (3 copies)/Ankyrin repeats (many copies)/Ankyrin repeat
MPFSDKSRTRHIVRSRRFGFFGRFHKVFSRGEFTMAHYTANRFFALVLFSLPVFVTGCMPSLVRHACKGNTDKVEALLDAGADVNAVSISQDTALHWACQHGDERMITALLAAGANPDARNSQENTPLLVAAWREKDNVVVTLLDHGVDVNAANEVQNTALHGACQHGNERMITALLAAGANPDARNSEENTPLLIAAIQGKDNAVVTLVDHGADVNAANKFQDTALHWACLCGNGKMVSALLAAGANPNAKTRQGATPLHLAASQRYSHPEQGDHYTEHKRLLLAAGADASVRCKGLLAEERHAGKGKKWTHQDTWRHMPMMMEQGLRGIEQGMKDRAVMGLK